MSYPSPPIFRSLGPINLTLADIIVNFIIGVASSIIGAFIWSRRENIVFFIQHNGKIFSAISQILYLTVLMPVKYSAKYGFGGAIVAASSLAAFSEMSTIIIGAFVIYVMSVALFFISERLSLAPKTV